MEIRFKISEVKTDYVNMDKKNLISYCLDSLVVILIFLSACSTSDTPPQNSMRLTSDRVARFSMQSRDFDITDRSELMRAVMNVVQDQHYVIREVNAGVGTLYADQTYDIGQPLSFFGIPITHFHQKPWAGGNLAIQLGPFELAGGQNSLYVVKKNSSVSVVLLPLENNKKGFQIHVSIEMRDFYNDGHVGEIWLVRDPKIYQNFFDALSKAIYLQAQS